MRRLIVSTFMTIDGVMQAPGGPEEDEDGKFDHGGWSVPYWDDMMTEVQTAAMGVPFDLLVGRRTYDLFASFWPHESEDSGAEAMNGATKYVVSRGRPDLPWKPAVLVEGPVGVAELKRQDGPELQVHGSADLIHTLADHGLVDEYRLWVFPVVLGKGKRLFPDGVRPAGLELADHKVSTTGVIISTYLPDGKVPTGSFE